MDFLDFAKKIESDGIALYKKLAIECSSEDLAGIFRFLAAEEFRHYEIFDAWQKQIESPDADSTLILGDPEELFKKATVAFSTLGVPAINYSDAYRKALTFEQESLKKYESALDLLDDENEKKQMMVIIEQEKIHVHLLTSLIDFSRHPGEWLENAEISHADEY